MSLPGQNYRNYLLMKSALELGIVGICGIGIEDDPKQCDWLIDHTPGVRDALKQLLHAKHYSHPNPLKLLEPR